MIKKFIFITDELHKIHHHYIYVLYISNSDVLTTQKDT